MPKPSLNENLALCAKTDATRTHRGYAHGQPTEHNQLGTTLARPASNVTQRLTSAWSSVSSDARSPMESKVLQWLQQTPFVLAHGDAVEIIPQFPVGDYLRQLDPTYQHPAWRVDFLVTVQTVRGALQIVIEYDGFEFHFRRDKPVHVGNHERYLVEADVERQLTLESYGYRFLRINRFNLGSDPVQTLSDRLYRLIEVAGTEIRSAAVDQVIEQVQGLESKEKKVCSRCGQIRSQEEFFDPDLRAGAGGVGRICMPCKAG